MAGNQLYANSQLMYYPTSALETHRMLGLVGKIALKCDRYARQLVLQGFKKILGDEAWIKISEDILDNNVDVDIAIYDYLIRANKYDLIDKYFNYTMGKKECTITIADLQAGEGMWLRTFKDFIPYYDNEGEGSSHIRLIGNELEEERFKQINADYSYCGSFEELQIPKKSISLLLFNPPYGETNGERNVRRYLRMTIERDYIAPSGYILMVIREDDARDITDIFNKYFQTEVIYRTHEDEYAKYKQVVILARKWHNPLNEKTTYGARDIMEQSEKYIKKLDDVGEFSLKSYNNRISSLPTVEIEQLMDNFEYIHGGNIVISNNNSIWKHIKSLTELKELKDEKLVLPKQPKQGEIANLLASGQINGVMEIEIDGEVNSHIVVGGVKTVETKENTKHKGADGSSWTENKIVRYSKPYLNILINKNGRYEVKELGVDSV